MKKLFASLCIIFFLFTGCMEQPANLEQTAIPTASPTPVPTEFVPAPLEPAELMEEQWKQMQQTKTCMTADGAVELGTSIHSYPLRYVDYYGTYQGYTAIRIHNTQYPAGTTKEEVAGCTFYYSGYSDKLFCRVLLWKNDTFYQLQYAYDQDLLTEEDIKTIAYYNNLRHFEPTVSAEIIPVPNGPTSMPEDFVPAPIEPAELSEDVWARIQNSYQYVVDENLFKGPSLEYHIPLRDLFYYGTYQDYLAIYIEDLSPYDWGDWIGNKIYLWKDDVFYRFQDALNLGLISAEDAKNIIYYHNIYYYKNYKD